MKIEQDFCPPVEIIEYNETIEMWQSDTIGAEPIEIEKSKSREVALVICPDLEREKEEFAVGFVEWTINNFNVVNFGFPTEPTFRKKGDKLYLSSQLIELYKNRER